MRDRRPVVILYIYFCGNRPRENLTEYLIQLSEIEFRRPDKSYMKYLCLMYLEEAAGQKVPQDEFNKGLAECKAYFEAIQRSGHLIAQILLQPTHTATTVRVREGKPLTTDGPF